MALEATHLRFALDLKDKYQVKDIERYVSGVIYPDSRYVTGIDRLLTHPEDYLDWRWDEADDFRKGWFVHLLTDHIQYQVTKQSLPQAFEGSRGQGSDVWISHSAIKILLDLDDAKKFDIKKYLPYLNYLENPNGEDLEKLKRYNQILVKMYADPEEMNMDVSCAMWKDFGISDDLIEKIRAKTLEYGRDAAIMQAIGGIYKGMLDSLNI